MNGPGPWPRPGLSSQPVPAGAIDDNPFISPTQMDRFRVSTATSYYGVEPFVYMNHPRAGTSTASLVSSRRESSTSTFDDSAHLTANVSSEPTDRGNWRTDSEHTAAATPRMAAHGVVRSVTVRSSPPFLPLERLSNRSPRAFTASRCVLSTLSAPASKMKIMFAWGATMARSELRKVMMKGERKWMNPCRTRAVSFPCADARSDSLGRPIASGSRCTIF